MPGRTPRRAIGVVLAVLAAAAAGCSGDCADIGLPTRVLPVDTTIAVGASFQAHLQSGGKCSGGPPHYSDIAAVWHTSDPAIATVDSLTGFVVGRADGDAQVTNVATTTTLQYTVTVHVR